MASESNLSETNVVPRISSKANSPRVGFSPEPRYGTVTASPAFT